MSKHYLVSLLALSISSVVAAAAPVKAPTGQASHSQSDEACSTQAQTQIVANVLSNRETKASPRSCSGQLDTILAKIVPTTSVPAKNEVKAYERDALLSEIAFVGLPPKIAELHRLRVFKKDGTQAEFKYGNKASADKAWSDWQSLYSEATDCEANAERVVADTKLMGPGFGRVECSRAYSRASKRYNPQVVAKGPGVVEWNGLLLSTSHIASVTVLPTVWVVFDGKTEAYRQPLYKLSVSTAIDGARPTWQAVYGKKADADAAYAAFSQALRRTEATVR